MKMKLGRFRQKAISQSLIGQMPRLWPALEYLPARPRAGAGKVKAESRVAPNCTAERRREGSCSGSEHHGIHQRSWTRPRDSTVHFKGLSLGHARDQVGGFSDLLLPFCVIA